MRIISGSKKGMSIYPPNDLPARPTTDRSKEGLFNILNNYYYFDEVSVLDLYSGTGSVSFEFASRGTPHIIAVEQDSHSIKFINKESERFEFYEIEPICIEVMSYLENTDETFDIIFADPPFNNPESKDMVYKVFEKQLLKPKGLLALEHYKKEEFGDIPHFIKKYKYGQTIISLFNYEGEMY